MVMKQTRMNIWRLFSSIIAFSRLRSRAPVKEFTNLRGRLAPFFSKVCPAKYVQIFKNRFMQRKKFHDARKNFSLFRFSFDLPVEADLAAGFAMLLIFKSGVNCENLFDT